MTTFFISRHPGAVEWIKQQSIHIDRWVSHLHTEDVNAGDTVIGTLPIHLAFEVCQRGARYLALEMSVPEHKRGQELNPEDLRGFSCKIEEYVISKPQGHHRQ